MSIIITDDCHENAVRVSDLETSDTFVLNDHYYLVLESDEQGVKCVDLDCGMVCLITLDCWVIPKDFELNVL